MVGPHKSLASYISAGLILLIVISNSVASPLSQQKNDIRAETTSKLVDPLPAAAHIESETRTTRHVKSSPTGDHTRIANTGTPTAVGTHRTANHTHTRPTSTPKKPPTTHNSSTSDSSCLLQKTGRSGSNATHSKREAPEHPSAKRTITLFHGTLTEEIAQKLKHPDLEATASRGDFNSGLQGSGRDPGGFYLTDSLVAAAQFVCYSKKLAKDAQRPEKVTVVEFTWKTSIYRNRIYEFASKSQQWDDFVDANLRYSTEWADPSKEEEARKILKDKVMITGPMGLAADDQDLTDDFWQYAIIDQQALDDSLVYVTLYDGILCSQIPKANGLSSEIYSQGQRTNDKFSQMVHDLQTPGCGPST